MCKMSSVVRVLHALDWSYSQVAWVDKAVNSGDIAFGGYYMTPWGGPKGVKGIIQIEFYVASRVNLDSEWSFFGGI